MSPTRRDLLLGLPTVAAAAVAGVAGAQVTHLLDDGLNAKSAPAPVPPPAPIPTDLELKGWEAMYKARYRMQHAAQNQVYVDAHTKGLEGEGERLDIAAQNAALEMDVADSLVDVGSEVAIASARDLGFGARREGLAATANPYWDPAKDAGIPPGYDHFPDRDRFMAWYAGWCQAGDQSHVYGPRGYTPPQPYNCANCGRAEGQKHVRTCYTNLGLVSDKRQCATVVRPRRPSHGITFT